MSVSIKLNSEYLSKKDAVLELVSSFENEGTMIMKGSRNTIKSNFLDDEKVTIKFFATPGLFKSIIYSFFKDSKAKRSFDYANYLIKNDVQTPKPIAFIEEKNSFGLLKNSYYLCSHIDYDFTIRELIHNPIFPERTIILEQFATFTFKMHEAKINFLDHSPGNTLIVKKDSANYDFYLIDLNRMKFEKLSIENRMDNFKKMWLSKTMVKVIAKKYAQLSSQSDEKLHQILLQKTKEFKGKITKKKYLKRKFKIN